MSEAAPEASANSRRPHGRSLDDFRDQSTESRLLPAEDKLLVAVLKGDICDVSDAEAALKFHAELDKALSDPEVAGLAAEMIANPWQLFRSTDEEQNENKKDDEKARADLEDRVGAQPRIVREFLTELSGFAEARAKAPEESKASKANVAANRDSLPPIVAELKKRFESELGHWRQIDPANPAVRVRASFVRFLALGGDTAVSVHEKGVALKGAYVDGALDLTSCEKVVPLSFDDCFFSKTVRFPGARLQRTSFSGCCVPSIEGTLCRTENSVFLDIGFSSLGPVRLIGAVIGGILDCGGGTFADGLDCTTGKITGDVFLSPHFNASGEVALSASEIGGSLFCSEGTFRNQTPDGRGKALNCDATKVAGSVSMKSVSVEGRVFLMGTEIGYSLDLSGGYIRNYMPNKRVPALQCQGAKIKGNVILRNGFVVEGGAGFAGAEIGGTLDCASATFSNLVATEAAADAGTASPMAEPALDLAHVTIEGAWWLRQHENDESPVPAKISGSVDLTGAHTRMLVDHPASWPEQRAASSDGQMLSCAIKLDGFTYDRFADGAPTDAGSRLIWLSLQPPPHLSTDFRPQPFEQLVKVLREMGHETDARQVAIAKLRNRRRARLDASFSALTDWPLHRREWVLKPYKFAKTSLAAAAWFFEWLILDFLLGYGYARAKPVLLFLLMLFGCAGYYDFAAKQSAFVPTNPVIYNNATYRAACAGKTLDIADPVDWYACKKMPFELNPFRPLVYSADQMLPFLQLGQKRDWQPISKQLRFNLSGIGKLTLPASTTLVVTWCQSIGSTMLYLFIAAILSGLIKRD